MIRLSYFSYACIIFLGYQTLHTKNCFNHMKPWIMLSSSTFGLIILYCLCSFLIPSNKILGCNCYFQTTWGKRPVFLYKNILYNKWCVVQLYITCSLWQVWFIMQVPEHPEWFVPCSVRLTHWACIQMSQKYLIIIKISKYSQCL